MAVKGSAEWRRRVSEGARRGLERRRARQRARPRDLDRLRREGLVAGSLRPLVDVAEAELREWCEALGGVAEVTPMRRAVLEDAAGLGIALRAELQRFLGSHDPAALERVSTLANSRRAALVAAGLDAAEPEAMDIRDYLAQRQRERETEPAGTAHEELQARAGEVQARKDVPEADDGGVRAAESERAVRSEEETECRASTASS